MVGGRGHHCTASAQCALSSCPTSDATLPLAFHAFLREMCGQSLLRHAWQCRIRRLLQAAALPRWKHLADSRSRLRQCW